jgi:DNA-binding FrmR family transcriptional regulator
LFREHDADQVERLLYRIQMLEGHIRVLVNHIDNAREEIKTLQTELIAKDSK